MSKSKTRPIKREQPRLLVLNHTKTHVGLLAAMLIGFSGRTIGNEDLLSSSSISVVGDPTRAQQAILPEPVPLDESQKTKKFDLPPLPEPKHIPATGGTVVIDRVQFEGNSVFSQAELETATTGFLHRQIHVSDIEAIRHQVSLYYADRGYINSGAVLESQSLSDGVLTLKIIEGPLTEVRLRGQERLPESYIRDRLLLGAGDPLSVNKLQDSYRLLLGDPLIEQLNGRLIPGNKLGEYLLDVNVVRSRPYQLYFTADDYQTPAVGEYAGRIGGWVDNLLALGERIDAQFTASGGALGYNTGISLPLNAYDTRFSFRYSDVSSSIIEAPVEAINLSNHVVGYDGGLTHPVYRTFADDLTLGVNFVVRQNRTLIDRACFGIESLGIDTCETQVTVLRMSQRYSHRGDGNSLVFWSTFNAGLDALGATTNAPGLQSGQFFSWLGQSMFTQRLLENGTHLVVKGNIQLADRPLLSLERYAIGGVYTVRGYRENTYVRDSGFNTNLELHYPLYNEGAGSLHLVPFVDYGGAWNSATAQLGEQATDYLFSAGIGFNWQYDRLSVDFYWAHAFQPVRNLRSDDHNIQDDGLHFRVNINAF